ncbi:MAG: endonuclease/exonuclease/phosphatase family protein [Candidatus Marinimicrobia bacterium]|nr:endonuclease/exonuclease/phosphatase family protein [Candidatus Neomarinimicrobiota bacterium]
MDIVTWNLHLFPSNGNASIEYMEDAILALQPDIIALQEVSSESSLQTLADNLDDYEYAIANGGGDWGLAYIYNSTEVALFTDPYEIYTGYWSPFPRPPFVFEANWNGKKIVIINNHLKAYGDIENIERRIEAIELLDEYIDENLNDERVVILGDMNDELTDDVNNVFDIMLNDQQSYFFTDLSIAQGSNLLWSYPSYPSHIDHIAITNELFSAHFETKTVLYDTYLDGHWTEYVENISDHRPVAISLVIGEE